MKLRHLLLVVVLAMVAGGVWYAVTLRNQPPELAFAHVVRESIASSVPTNGKIEPIEWAEARAERDGPVTSIVVQRGAQVAAGAALIELDSAEARAELVAAQARVSQVKAELDVIERGGRATDLSAIAGELDREKLELAVAQKEYDSLVRLQAKQAATAYEVAQAKDKVDRAQAQIRSLEQRRGRWWLRRIVRRRRRGCGTRSRLWRWRRSGFARAWCARRSRERFISST